MKEQDEAVNTVTNKGSEELDLEKANIYPLVDVYISSFTFPSTNVIRFNVQLAAVAQRDTNKEIGVDKFWGQDNRVDNMNTAAAIINRIWVSMNKGFDENDIIASNDPTFDEIENEFMNNLDGWSGKFWIAKTTKWITITKHFLYLIVCGLE